jgi:hypothetical protein
MKQVTNTQDYQLAAIQIASRLRRDNVFAERLRSDPVETLRSLGIGMDAVRELIREDASLRNRARVDHAAALDCDIISCICTDSCCVTCWTTTDLWVTGRGSFRQVIFGKDDPVLKPSPEKEKLLNVLIERGHISTPD